MTWTTLLLLVNLAVLCIVLYNAKNWPRVEQEADCATATVSVLIPARNEENNIERVLASVLGQSGVLEILVYDDHSSDSTSDKVREMSRRFPELQLVSPAPIPSGWFGKPFACYQLAQRAKGKWLLFLDADVELEKCAVARMVKSAERWKATLLSCWPGLEMKSWAERFFMPLLNFVVFSLFPAPISLTWRWPSLGLAHGACILVERESYHRIGGHALVKAELFEDTALARAWRHQGLFGICLDGQDVVRVRMYDSLLAIWRGFEKIAYPAFRSKSNFWLFVIFHFSVFVWPFAYAVGAMAGGQFAIMEWACVVAAVAARVVQALQFGYSVPLAVWHAIAECGLIAVALDSAAKCILGLGVEWKGRRYQPAARG